jgi:hypothetical protein
MNKKTDLVFEYFEKKYEFDIQKLGIDKYQINHFFQSNNKYFDNKDSIKLMILQIEKMIDHQIKDNKKIISNESIFLKDKIERSFTQVESHPPMKPIIIQPKIDDDKFIYIYLDSKDRQFGKNKYPNKYSIDIKPMKIKKIQLLEVILKNSEKDQDSSDSIDKYPYIILNINILKKSNIASNNTLSKGGIILSNYDEKNDFKYYLVDKNVIELDNSKVETIEVEFLKPNGELFNFGFNNSQSMNTINFLKFKAIL